MIITTTNNIDRGTIIKYLGIVSSNIVIGVNVFSELIASFTDFFGGNSETYETKLNIIFNESLSNLSKKAQRLGADAIIGLKLDYEEISGKDKSMIMVYAMGTAVRVSFNSDQKDSPKDDSKVVTSEELHKLLLTKRYKVKFTHLYPTQEDYECITQNEIYGLEQEIYNLYIEADSKQINEQAKIICHNLLSFQLDNIPFEEACELVYSRATEVSYRFLVCQYIKERNLFSPQKTLEFLNQGENKVAISLLKSDKDFYTIEDKRIMNIIFEKLDTLSHSNYSLDNDQKKIIKTFNEKVELINSFFTS